MSYKSDLLHELCDASRMTSVRGSDGPSLLITACFPSGLNLAVKYVCGISPRLMLHVKHCFSFGEFN